MKEQEYRRDKAWYASRDLFVSSMDLVLYIVTYVQQEMWRRMEFTNCSL